MDMAREAWMYSGDSKIEKKVTFILAAAGQGKRMEYEPSQTVFRI